MLVETPTRGLADLVVPEATRAQILALVTKIRHHKVLYEDFGLGALDPTGGRTAVNFYGPPGTGKTLAAEALAHELGLGLLRANYGELESKFVGETAKNIQSLFRRAKETGALLFFDEADSILGKRLDKVSQSTDHAVNVSRSVMLLELDQFPGVTVFATNLASNYDPAFVRRILCHVPMPLPDAPTRLRLWRRHLPDRLPHDLGPSELEILVTDSDGLSGGDLLSTVLQAASRALEREGPPCRIGLADFQAALVQVRRAKAEVGVS